MYNNNISLRFLEKCILATAAVALGLSLLVLVPGDANAHTSPGGCNSTGVNLSLIVYRADGTTPVGAGTAVEGETLKYEATLSHAGGSNCNYQGGTLNITTPDGSVSNVAGVIPLISAGNPFVSSQATYIATAADAAGDDILNASATYAGGTSHLGGDVTPVGATAPAATPFVMALEVEKTVDATFDRAWTWSIDKSADQTELDLADGETATVNYDVVLAASSTETNHMVSGTITITNPNSIDATVASVTDELDNGGALAVDCTGDAGFAGFPHVLGSDETLTCTYSGDSDGTDTENTATASTTGEVPGGTVTEPVAFSSDPTNEVDECVTVNDTNSAFPGDTVVCADDADKTIEYAVDFGPDGSDVVVECGDGSHPNTADFVTNDTQATGDDDETVNWTVNCDSSCTLTQGYWKNHTSDETWDLLANSENTTFFLSGQTWLAVFNTPPKGNVYYNLAHQYMAAYLNTLNGASIPSDVQDALDDAEAFFTATTPDQAKSLTKAQKAELTTLAGLLGSYNEGAVGPGHCDD